jgi:hypothetical protein
MMMCPQYSVLLKWFGLLIIVVGQFIVLKGSF